MSSREPREETRSLRHGTFKTILYIVILAVLLSFFNLLFSWASAEEIPPYLQPYSSVIMLVHPYLIYIQGGLVFVFGYLTVNAISGLMYSYMRRISDHTTAATIRTVTKISGIAVLLSVMTSVFNVNPSAALTVGSFGGLVVGFATQTILSHVVAGVFLLISRPFTISDTVTVAGQTGIVKEVRLMHLVLEAEDGTREILIPSGTVVTQIIQKMRPPKTPKPIETNLVLDPPPTSVAVGSRALFTGKLVETASGNPVLGTEVRLLDRDIGRDDHLAPGVTQSDGSFKIEWTVKRTDWQDNTAEVYVKFDGNDDYRESESKQYTVTLKGQRNR